MPRWPFVVFFGLTLLATPAWTQVRHGLNPPATRQLGGLDANEANSLISKLTDAQHQLKAGKFESFELLAGAAASYAETGISPRTAFLQTPFDKVWQVTRIRAVNGGDDPRRTYSLSYAPNGLGQLYWEIEVGLDFNGDLARVTMVYKAPAPF